VKVGEIGPRTGISQVSKPCNAIPLEDQVQISRSLFFAKGNYQGGARGTGLAFILYGGRGYCWFRRDYPTTWLQTGLTILRASDRPGVRGKDSWRALT